MTEHTNDRFVRIAEMFEGAGLHEFLEEAFRRVHASNMSKLGDDGKPLRREDGKILKGPNYAPPVLLDLITGETRNV